FFVYTANPPKHPELCSQYHDDTFIKPNNQFIPEAVEKG
ncbi:MAG: phytanoyl-CoA dioxygenase, partial [Sphaerospermopsis kisseleviana]